MKRRAIPIYWTCCNNCRTVHRNRFFARLHFIWLCVSLQR